MKNIFNFLADPKKRYCIRKLSVGVCSILIGMSLFGAQEVEARQKPSSTEIEATSLVSQRENKEPLGESLANQGQNSQSVSHEASPSSELKANLVANDQAKSVTDGDEEAETVVKNILKGKRPTTNSDSLIESNSSTGPDLAIQNPSKATDGVKETGIDDKTNTKIIAGKETGGEDNGYASWKPVYLQYDFGKEVEVNSLNIYRNSYKNALSTFKKVKIELSTDKEFKPEAAKLIFPEADIEEKSDTKGKPQIIELEQAIKAQYIRIWGQGHYIQNTNSNWKGYSNGLLFNEIEVMARLPKGKTDQDPEKLVNLAQLKAPYVYGQIPSHLNYINDGKFDDNYAINKSLGKDSFIQYEFKNAYTLKSIRLKVKPGSYSQFRVDVDDDADPKKSSKTLYNKHNLKVNQDEIITIPLEEGIETQYVRFTAVRADGAPTAYSEIEILGYGDSYDEAGPTYSDRSSKYNTLVWSDEFNGEQVDQSKWNIIDGMVNHAAIYNKKAVSIKKEGDESYLAINSKNYGSSQALVDAVGRDAYSNDKLDKKVTWSSGRIEAKDKYSFQNGRVLVRAKVNDSQGIWPAIWMLAQDETGHDEIDIMEYLGQNPWDIWTTNHYGILDKNKASHGQANKNYEAWSQAFHIFEVEWSPEKITWFIDGKQVFETNRGKDTLDAMHNRPMFPILETQVGDGWVGPVDYSKNVTKQDSDYLVDWIRIYQEENHKKVSFDNLDHTADDGYHLNPIKQVGKLTFVSDGKEAYQDKNNFYYGGQPRYEKSRLYSSDNSQENALIYKIDQPQSIHLTTYYKTLEDAKSYSNAAAAYKGQSIRAHLVGQAIDFEVYSSVDGENWRKENVKVLDNFVEASPAYARTSFDVNQLSHDSRYVKVVFPNLKDKTYKNLKGQIKPIDNWDVQLAKVTFTR